MNKLSLAGTQIDCFHVCAFFNSRDEEFEILGPFFREGIEQGEKNLHILNPNLLDDHRERLTSYGIDVDHCESCGTLELMTWGQAYLDESGAFDKARMLEAVQGACNSALERGIPRVRIMGDMDWVFGDVPGNADIIEYEAEVNEVLSQYRHPAVCVYDIAKLSGSMMMDILRTHPLTLINGVVQENPFFSPASDMLAEIQARKQQQSEATN